MNDSDFRIKSRACHTPTFFQSQTELWEMSVVVFLIFLWLQWMSLRKILPRIPRVGFLLVLYLNRTYKCDSCNYSQDLLFPLSDAGRLRGAGWVLQAISSRPRISSLRKGYNYRSYREGRPCDNSKSLRSVNLRSWLLSAWFYLLTSSLVVKRCCVLVTTYSLAIQAWLPGRQLTSGSSQN